MLRMAVFLAVVIAVCQAVAQTISFAPVELYSAGFSPTHVLAADLNADGYPELIVNNNTTASNGLGSLIVLTNDGTGHFGLPMGYGPRDGAAQAAGDLDGDGDLDIVVGTSLHGNYWYENDGNGILTQHSLPSTGMRPVDAALLDYDQDGNLDIGFVTYRGDFEYSRNEGGAIFEKFNRRRLFYGDYVESWPTAINAVDLDGDALPEFVFASHASRTFVRLDWNGHHFRPTVMHNVGRVDSVAYGELDGKPGIDAVFTHDAGNVGSPSPGVWIDGNDGAGALSVSARIRRDLPELISPQAVAIADFDQDGLAEIAISDSFFSQGLQVASRTPDGSWHGVWHVNLGGNGYFLTTADLNKDGKPDVVAANGSGGGVAVLMNTTP